jgi:hypothetical protein
MDSPEQVSNEFRRKLRGKERSRREQLFDSSKVATDYKFRAPLLSPLIQRGFFTASPERVGHPEKLNQSPGVDVLEWYHPTVSVRQQKKRERVGHPPLLSTSFPTDLAYGEVLDGVRKDLGRDIDFSKQSDREAIGNSLIDHVRTTGGCDVTGNMGSGC